MWVIYTLNDDPQGCVISNILAKIGGGHREQHSGVEYQNHSNLPVKFTQRLHIISCYLPRIIHSRLHFFRPFPMRPGLFEATFIHPLETILLIRVLCCVVGRWVHEEVESSSSSKGINAIIMKICSDFDFPLTDHMLNNLSFRHLPGLLSSYSCIRSSNMAHDDIVVGFVERNAPKSSTGEEGGDECVPYPRK